MFVTRRLLENLFAIGMKGLSSSRVFGQGFTLSWEILLNVFQFKDETTVVFRKTLLCEILDTCSLLIPILQNSNGQ